MAKIGTKEKKHLRFSTDSLSLSSDPGQSPLGLWLDMEWAVSWLLDMEQAEVKSDAKVTKVEATRGGKTYAQRGAIIQIWYNSDTKTHVWGLFPQHQLGVLQFNSILTLSIWR